LTRHDIKMKVVNFFRSGVIFFAAVFALSPIIVSEARAQIFSAHLSQVDKSEFPTIKLYLDLVDNTNRPVEGIAKNAFKIFEDGQLVEVAGFADPSTPRPLTTVLVLDRSGSMAKYGKIEGLRTAASMYVRSMKEMDQTSVIGFSDSVQEIQPLTSRKDLLNGALESLSAGGGTAFYDAVHKAIKVASDVKGRKVVLAITDGMDNKSSKSIGKPVELAKQYGIPIYTIGLGAKATGTSGEEGIYEEGLRNLAEQTGGLYFYAPSAAELAGIYEQLSRRFQSGYELAYITPRQIEDGTTRTVSVTASLKDNSLTATNSYYMPGVIVPSANPYLFVGLLIPLLLLILAPTALKRLGPIHISILWSRITGWSQKGKTFVKRSRESLTAEDALYLGPLVSGSSKALAVKKGVYYIGSDPGNNLVISHASISPKHARIQWEKDRYVVHDLGSKAGTFVSYSGDLTLERRIDKSALKVGSSVRFGEIYFRFCEKV